MSQALLWNGLSRWTLADLLARPTPGRKPPDDGLPCKMKFAGWERYFPEDVSTT